MGEITHRDLTWAGCQHLVGYDITEIEDMIAGWGPNCTESEDFSR
jgi:hypothetical protein